MNLRLWRYSHKRAIAPRRLLVWAGLLVLAVGALLPSFFPQPAGAASRQTQVAPTGGTPRLEVLTNAGGTMYHEWSDDDGATWSSLTSLGNPGVPLSGTPTAVSDGPAGRLTIFSNGILKSDNTFQGLWQGTFSNGRWFGWSSIPGVNNNGDGVGFACNTFFTCWYAITSAPTVTSWGPGRMDLFVKVSSGDLVHTSADNYSWSGTWDVVGPDPLQGTPTAVSSKPGRIDVFGRGTNNELEHNYLSAGRWSGWENLGGVLTSDPSVTSPGSGLLNVYARGTDGQLHGNSYNNFVWSGWGAVGCCLAGLNSPIAAVSPAQNTVDAFVIGTDQSLYRKVYNSTTGWTEWQFSNHHPISYSNIAAAEWFPPVPTPTPPPCAAVKGSAGGGSQACPTPGF